MVAGLPDISLDDSKLGYSLADFKAELYPELSDEDRRLMDLYFLKFDNEALLALLKDKDAQVEEGKGVFGTAELLSLIEAVRAGDVPDRRFPPYMARFIERFLALTPEEQDGAADLLASLYYAYATACKNTFVAAWFDFNLNVNNILAAFAARKYKMDVAAVVVGDTAVCAQLRTSGARDFGLGETLPYFDTLQRIAETPELVERERKTDLLRWKWLEDEAFFHYFTVERIFVFLMQLEMIARWTSLDKEKGGERFRQLVQQLKDEVQIPAEFRK